MCSMRNLEDDPYEVPNNDSLVSQKFTKTTIHPASNIKKLRNYIITVCNKPTREVTKQGSKKKVKNSPVNDRVC